MSTTMFINTNNQFNFVDQALLVYYNGKSGKAQIAQALLKGSAILASEYECSEDNCIHREMRRRRGSRARERKHRNKNS